MVDLAPRFEPSVLLNICSYFCFFLPVGQNKQGFSKNKSDSYKNNLW